MKGSLACAPIAFALATWASIGEATAGPVAPPAPLACTDVGPIGGAAPILSSVVRQTDPIHKGHLHLVDQPGDLFPASQCGVPNSIPPVVEEAQDFHYKTFTFENRAQADSCVRAELHYYQCGQTEPCPPEITCKGDVASGICGGVGFHEVTVYLGAFDPSNIRRNFVADSGRISAGPGIDHVEFNMAAFATFTVVVRAEALGTTVGTGLGYDPYFDLYVWGCGQHIVTNVAPSSGPSTGGTTVMIHGSGFSQTRPTAVTIGSNASNIVVVDDRTVNAVTSAASPGTHDVTVEGAFNGQRVISTLKGAFTSEEVDAPDARAPSSDDPRAPKPGDITLDENAESTKDGCQTASSDAPTFALVLGALAALGLLGRRRRET